VLEYESPALMRGCNLRDKGRIQNDEEKKVVFITPS
jgi:hypothetical protein